MVNAKPGIVKRSESTSMHGERHADMAEDIAMEHTLSNDLWFKWQLVEAFVLFLLL